MKKIFIIVIILVGLQIIQTSLFYTPPTIDIPKDAKYICYVDFGKWSCFDRLYIYNVEKKRIVYSARVQHGIGGNSNIFKPEFSNRIGSNCSSLGLYRISCLSKMSNGVECFRLKGLSPSNSNAAKRAILVHPGFGVSLIPVGLLLPLTPESKGCFTVSIVTMLKLKACFKKGNIYIYAYK